MKILQINPKNPEPEKLELAARIIQKDGLVAFPTETVYALGANALSVRAVEKVFEVKRRPQSNPLIVGISSKDQIKDLVIKIPPLANKLIGKFFPGPLTLVLPKSDLVPKITCAELDKIAFRMPDHPVALKLIAKARVPIVVPSANISGAPSPKTALEVVENLGDKVDLVLDGGETPLGIESTIVDLTSQPAKVLRLGALSIEELTPILGELELSITKDRRRI